MRYALASVLAICCAATLITAPAGAADPVPNPLQDSASWQDMRGDILGDVPISDGASLLQMDAPYRANDAATVPLVLTQTDASAVIHRATVVIDENPAPVAAEFDFSEVMAPLEFELRVRVNQYSNVRVITETDAGIQMIGRYVKASGGCSAPASKNPELALESMGQMKLRMFPQAAAPMTPMRREAQIMLRHPNYSGLQRDQITQLFIPAHFIDHLEVWQGEERLFSMDGGISISENPVFRFRYLDNGAPDLRIMATDTEGNTFDQTLPKAAEG